MCIHGDFKLDHEKSINTFLFEKIFWSNFTYIARRLKLEFLISKMYTSAKHF